MVLSVLLSKHKCAIIGINTSHYIIKGDFVLKCFLSKYQKTYAPKWQLLFK